MRTQARCAALSLIALIAPIVTASAAEIVYQPGKVDKTEARAPIIKLKGEIDNDAIVEFSHYAALADANAKKLGFIVEDQPHGLVTVELDSPGGGMMAGMEIGMKMRRMNFGARVPKGAVCASACVFLLAGGVSRSVEGRVGIHRQYVKDDDLVTPEQQRASYAEDEKLIKAYYKAVNIPTTLYDRQLRIPGNEIVWLSKSELQTYGLDGDDPYYYEAMNAAVAKKHGLTKFEFSQVVSSAKKICNNPKTAFACVQRLLAERASKK